MIASNVGPSPSIRPNLSAWPEQLWRRSSSPRSPPSPPLPCWLGYSRVAHSLAHHNSPHAHQAQLPPASQPSDVLAITSHDGKLSLPDSVRVPAAKVRGPRSGHLASSCVAPMQTLGIRPRLRGRRSLVDLMVGSNRAREEEDAGAHQGRPSTASAAESPSPRLTAAYQAAFGGAPVAEEEHAGAPDGVADAAARPTEPPAGPCFETTKASPGQHMTPRDAAQPEAARPVSQRHASSTQCGKTSSAPPSPSTASPVACSVQDPTHPPRPELEALTVQASQASPHPPHSPTPTSQPTSQRLTSPGDPPATPPSTNRAPDAHPSDRAANPTPSSKMAPVCCPDAPPLAALFYRSSGRRPPSHTTPVPRPAPQLPPSLALRPSNNDAEQEQGR